MMLRSWTIRPFAESIRMCDKHNDMEANVSAALSLNGFGAPTLDLHFDDQSSA
jgi:hypothetical protein